MPYYQRDRMPGVLQKTLCIFGAAQIVGGVIAAAKLWPEPSYRYVVSGLSSQAADAVRHQQIVWAIAIVVAAVITSALFFGLAYVIEQNEEIKERMERLAVREHPAPPMGDYLSRAARR